MRSCIPTSRQQLIGPDCGSATNRDRAASRRRRDYFATVSLYCTMTPVTIAALVALLVFCVIASSTPTSKRTTRHKQLINFLAGGVAGSISSTLTLPLEIVKTQLQSSRIAGTSGPAGVVQRIWKSEGPGGFFKGLQPMLVGIAPTRAIYFWAYSTSKGALHAKLGNTPANHILSAFAAGIASNTVRTWAQG